MGNEQYYQKLNITEKSENSTHMFLSYNISQAEDLMHFNSTNTNQSLSILSGNVAQDFFSNITFINTVLSHDVNFSSQMSELDSMMAEFGEDEDFRADFSVSPDGLSISISFYYRLVIFFLVMTMHAYYSTDRILLRYEMWVRNPTGNEQANMTFTILPEYSTPASATEDPYDPLQTGSNDLSTDDTSTGEDPFDSKPQSFIFYWKSGLIIGGVIAGAVSIGVGIRILVQSRKKKKQHISML
ncbi:MAG: hypothetical protein E4G98_06585 [Promethearchaeota archaeon]|nr:MAG: hypothetical protein E4G98_06585 [Candidatus Lokiarchaeota archaeon]